MSNTTTFDPTANPVVVYGFIFGELAVAQLLYTLLAKVLDLGEVL